MKMTPEQFFLDLPSNTQRKYEALRAFYFEKLSAEEVAKRFHYKMSTVYSMTRDFRKICENPTAAIESFFVEKKAGRKTSEGKDTLVESIVDLRKKYLSVTEIKAILDSRKMVASEQQIYQILRAEGFERLPRRSQKSKREVLTNVPIEAPKAELLKKETETFRSDSVGVLSFLPYLINYGITEVISTSAYPESKTMPKLNSILNFVALKLSNVQRYEADDLWCMDRGLGLFSGLNVLPKTSWFSAYSHRVTNAMNVDFLKRLHRVWLDSGFLSDTVNLDFVALPYWGDDTHLENNSSGTRRHTLTSILAALSQDPDSGLITHADATVRHDRESQIVTEFVDFYKKDVSQPNLRYLVFDSKFTTYENLGHLNNEGICFLTIRRRGQNILTDIAALPASDWTSIQVPGTDEKSRSLQVHESHIKLRGYGEEPVRQITIKGHGKIKPALIITNDFNSAVSVLIRKYARRWLVEKTISEQTHFFHLNRLSSSMVIKVDFDLTMTILAHNLYRLFALELPGYEHCSANTLYKKFIYNSGSVVLDEASVTVWLNKKRHQPVLISTLEQVKNLPIPWLHNRRLKIELASCS